MLAVAGVEVEGPRAEGVQRARDVGVARPGQGEGHLAPAGPDRLDPQAQVLQSVRDLRISGE